MPLSLVRLITFSLFFIRALIISKNSYLIPIVFITSAVLKLFKHLANFHPSIFLSIGIPSQFSNREVLASSLL
jgi:hypothetical protein